MPLTLKEHTRTTCEARRLDLLQVGGAIAARRAASQPAVEVHRHGTEIASGALEADVTVGPHQVLGGILSVPYTESRQHPTTGIHQRAVGRAPRQVVDHNEPRVSRNGIGSLDPVPHIARPTQNEMKVWTGQGLLQIRLAPVLFDPGVRKAVSNLRALGDGRTISVSNPELRHERKEVRRNSHTSQIDEARHDRSRCRASLPLLGSSQRRPFVVN